MVCGTLRNPRVSCARGAGTDGDVLNRDTEGVLNVHTVPCPPPRPTDTHTPSTTPAQHHTETDRERQRQRRDREREERR